METMQTMGVGMVVSILFVEAMNLSPGGLIVPGYIALAMGQPMRIVVTLGIAWLTGGIVWCLSHYMVLFGRRRLACMILIGFMLKWGWMLAVRDPALHLSEHLQAVETIGFVIPGLVANSIEVQGARPTLAGIFVAAVLVKLLVIVFGGLPW